MSRKHFITGILLAVVVAVIILYANREAILARFFEPTQSAVEERSVSPETIRTAATNLETPWSISFLPDGDMLVSERGGRLQRVGESGRVYPIGNVRETSEGGLLGIALHPRFEENRLLYLYYTTLMNGTLVNRVDRALLGADELSEQKTILDGIPAASNHNGGAIEFGPDEKVYITTGDAAEERLAQDTSSLAGKILRLNDDGSVPSDNPFNNEVWSYGHRNPQGIAWDEDGRLWSVEHGPSGARSGRDELNMIEKGANYGWPEITGDEKRAGMESPVIQSGDNDTWAPARLAISDGKLYFTGLRGQSLYEVTITEGTPTMKRYFSGEYGRLRAMACQDDTLYIGTSNRDGRGSPRDGDDKIIKVPVALLR